MTKDIRNKLKKGTTCYTYVGVVGTDTLTFTKCKIDSIGFYDDLFIVRYKGLGGIDVVDHELKYVDYKKTWWLKEDKSE